VAERGDSGEPAPAARMFDADGALSRDFLLERGFCCNLGCKNCPYEADDPAVHPAEE
jgi:hypothetical protein